MKYRHVKTGNVYEVRGIGKMKARPGDGEFVTYRNIETGQIWIRPREEFYDGRFVRVDDATPEENLRLRVMLACAYCGPLLYRDDGELQDNRTIPFIDFVRDSVDVIENKMRDRMARAILLPKV